MPPSAELPSAGIPGGRLPAKHKTPHLPARVSDLLSRALHWPYAALTDVHRKGTQIATDIAVSSGNARHPRTLAPAKPGPSRLAG